jgi:hypothetical protein
MRVVYSTGARKPLLCVVAFTTSLYAILGIYNYKRDIETAALPIWLSFPRLNGFYYGLQTIVPHHEVIIENMYGTSPPLRYEISSTLAKDPSIQPILYDPYPKPKSGNGMQDCYLDNERKITVPGIYAYPGIPAVYPEPLYGSHKTLGLRDDICFERVCRFGPYGYESHSQHDKERGVEPERGQKGMTWEKDKLVDYTHVDWKQAQQRCYEKNKARFVEK